MKFSLFVLEILSISNLQFRVVFSDSSNNKCKNKLFITVNSVQECFHLGNCYLFVYLQKLTRIIILTVQRLLTTSRKNCRNGNMSVRNKRKKDQRSDGTVR